MGLCQHLKSSFFLLWLEATIVVHGVCGKLEALGIPVQPLHDGILIPKDYADVAKEVMVRECSKFVGATPHLHEHILEPYLNSNLQECLKTY